MAILAIHTHMVTNNPRMSVIHNGHNFWTLRINNVQLNDSGSYSCQINTEPMTTQVGILNVVYPPDITTGPNTSNDTIVAEGDSVKLMCEATGYPEPTIIWKREDGSDPQLQRVEGNELKLQRLTRSDFGAYLCIAVNGIPPVVSKRIMLNIGVPPDIIIGPNTFNDTIVAEGDSITLRCEVEGYPEPTVIWAREDQTPIVQRNPQGKITQTLSAPQKISEENELKLEGLTKADMGAYLCYARNGIPPSVSKRIRVHDHFPDPGKVQDQIIRTRLGSTVTLKCIVDAYNAYPITSTTIFYLK